MTFSWISTEREKQIVLRASRLMQVRRSRLLRSIRCVKILPVRCFSFGTSLTWLPRSSLVTMPIQNGVNRANSSRQVSSFLWLESVSQHTTSFSVVAPCCQRSSIAQDTPQVIAESVEAMIGQLNAEIKRLDRLIRSASWIKKGL